MRIALRLLAVSFLVIVGALNATAEYQSQHTIRIFSTPSAALTAMDALESEQKATAAMVPVHSLATYSQWGAADGASYALIYSPATSDTTCQIQGDGNAQPAAWTAGNASLGQCSFGLSGWAAEAYSTMAAARTFYDSLDTTQKGTAMVITSVGVQRSTARYVVIYQNYAGLCP